MSELEPPAAGAGWYEDPLRPGQQRWFDGQTWTDAVLSDEEPPTRQTGNDEPPSTEPAGTPVRARNRRRVWVLGALATVALIGTGLGLTKLGLDGAGDGVATSPSVDSAQNATTAMSEQSPAAPSTSGNVSELPTFEVRLAYGGPRSADQLTPLLLQNLGSIVQLDVTIENIPPSDSAQDRNNLSALGFTYSGCGGSTCGGTALRLRGIYTSGTSHAYYKDGDEILSGYFLVIYTRPENGGFTIIGMRAISPDDLDRLLARIDPTLGTAPLRRSPRQPRRPSGVSHY